jgi:glycosyltransferase involved in cell wall biosynthesis
MTVVDGAPPRATIVIICYTERRWESLQRAIESATCQTQPSPVIVVVDHNDVLLGRLRTEAGDGVLVVPNEFPRGASGARNTGALKAQTDIVAFLDDDATAPAQWVERMVSEMARSGVVGAGTKIVACWSDRPSWFPGLPDRVRKSRRRIRT